MLRCIAPVALVAAAAVGFAAARPGPAGPQTAQAAEVQQAAHNTLSAAERAAGWKLLFDGKTTNGWRGYQMKEMPAGWKVVDGMLTKDATTEDIVTTEMFGDFEFTMEWKLAARGNSGLFYRATEEYNRVYWSAIEYQLLDDSLARDGRNALTSAGAVYGFYPAPRGVVKPAGEWNVTKVVAHGAHVEHWMNGQRIAAFELWSPDFTAKYDSSKFKPYPNFARATSGLIAIQGDHNGTLQLRNIKIRPIGGAHHH